MEAVAGSSPAESSAVLLALATTGATAGPVNGRTLPAYDESPCARDRIEAVTGTFDRRVTADASPAMPSVMSVLTTAPGPTRIWAFCDGVKDPASPATLTSTSASSSDGFATVSV